MNVFPEDMNRVDTTDAVAAIRQLENYIRYIRERVEFSANSLVKTVSSNMTTAEVVQRLTDMEQRVASALSTIATYSGSISILQTDVRTINNTDLPDIRDNITSLNGSVNDLGERVGDLETQVDTLTAYVPAAGQGAPGTTTEGTPGQIYRDVLNGKIYICISAGEIEGEPVYLWREITLTEPEPDPEPEP